MYVIFNRSITTGIFPEEWKCSKVIPLLKQGQRSDFKNNYRPISIIPVVAKVFERVVYDQFYYVFNIFPRKMTSEERAQKFHTDDASLLRSG